MNILSGAPMKNIGDRVREKMDLLGIKQDRLAALCGVEQPQISLLVRGKVENPTYIYELAKALETSVKWLKTGIQDEERSNVSPFPDKTNYSLTETYVNSLVPVYGSASASMPGTIRISEEFMVDQVLRHPGIAHVKDSFALYVDGDSMSPRRDHGEMIYIHPYKEPLIGQDCVVVEEPEGNALYKRYCGKTEDGTRVILKQFNPPAEFTLPLSRIRKIYSVIF